MLNFQTEFNFGRKVFFGIDFAFILSNGMDREKISFSLFFGRGARILFFSVFLLESFLLLFPYTNFTKVKIQLS